MATLNKNWEYKLSEFAKPLNDLNIVEWQLCCEKCEETDFEIYTQEIVHNKGDNEDFMDDKLPLKGMYLKCSNCGEIQTHPY